MAWQVKCFISQLSNQASGSTWSVRASESCPRTPEVAMNTRAVVSFRPRERNVESNIYETCLNYWFSFSLAEMRSRSKYSSRILLVLMSFCGQNLHVNLYKGPTIKQFHMENILLLNSDHIALLETRWSQSQIIAYLSINHRWPSGNTFWQCTE